MNERPLVKKKRNLPHWTLDKSLYFVTFRAASTSFTDVERSIILQHLRDGENKYYLLASLVIMPDHVHLILKPVPPYNLPRIMKGIKGVSARKVNIHRNSKRKVWQDESWDRIVRDEEDFHEKLTYIANNPVKNELVNQIEDYPFWYFNARFC